MFSAGLAQTPRGYHRGVSTTTASLADRDAAERVELRDRFQSEYDALVALGLSLDLTRGKPSAAQLDLSDALLALPGEGRYRDAAGTDLRNYGGLQGLPELRAIFSDVLRVPVPQLLAAGNSSLTLMHDVLAAAMLHGVPGGPGPWFGRDVALLCPVPGYDRHFSLAESLGIRLIPIGMTDEGPDVDEAARLAAADESIVGIWCVPVHSNPTGASYSERVARALVSMPAAASDFRILWDNAYAVHHLTDDPPAPLDVLGLAAEAGNPDRPVVFASTSKITYPGAGVAFLGSSPANTAWTLGWMAMQTIGPDKINQLRHVDLLGSPDGVAQHMARHRALLEPKFVAVDAILAERLAPYGAGTWTQPTGGYFISLDVLAGTARRAVELAGLAGIAVTPAGATFPYGDDPDDANIRLAPTMPLLADLEAAMQGLCTCILLAAAEAAVATGA